MIDETEARNYVPFFKNGTRSDDGIGTDAGPVTNQSSEFETARPESLTVPCQLDFLVIKFITVVGDNGTCFDIYISAQN